MPQEHDVNLGDPLVQLYSDPQMVATSSDDGQKSEKDVSLPSLLLGMKPKANQKTELLNDLILTLPSLLLGSIHQVSHRRNF